MKYKATIYKKGSALRAVYPGVTKETIDKYKKTQPRDEVIEIEEEMSKGKQDLWIHRGKEWDIKPKRRR